MNKWIFNTCKNRDLTLNNLVLPGTHNSGKCFNECMDLMNSILIIKIGWQQISTLELEK